ncbi:MAG: 50S ribosomal protein L10 [Candidatus Micrarchaeia archaeon]
MTKRKGFKKLEKAKVRPGAIKKVKQVEEISAKISKAKTVAVLDVRGLPDRLLQASRKQLRGKAEFLMAKNTVLKRALENTKNGKTLAPLLDMPSVVVLSDTLSPYAIFRHFKINQQKVAAKPGQVADADIIVPAGDTDLPPGPALSELKAAKINASIKGGKIAVAKDSLVAKKGEKIESAVCKGLQKLNILPFLVGVNMVAGVQEGFMYNAQILNVDEATLTADLKASAQDAYNMSINCSYPTELNRIHLLAGAIAQSKALATQPGVYSNDMGLLLAQAIRMQNGLEGKVGQASS